jgi:NAD(P)-dependent dehydrogenase (short-subunit alcohol dehydrogenase family)
VSNFLDGRVVIVTGAGRGLGRAHAHELAARGATVVVNDLGVDVAGAARDDVDVARGVVDEIVASGGRAIGDAGSVTDWDAMQSLVDRTVDQFGKLDAIVNNAGIVRDRMITGLGEDDFDAVMATHVKGAFALTHHACAYWRALAKAGDEVSGRIINTTSGAGLAGNIGQSAYGAAKAAIAALTIITAMEMERYGVTANAISPFAQTRMTADLDAMQSGPDDGAGEWDPKDPANASPVVAWLASAESGWLSGAVLRIIGSALQRVRPWEIDVATQYNARSGERLTADEVGRALRRMYGTIPTGTLTVT